MSDVSRLKRLLVRIQSAEAQSTYVPNLASLERAGFLPKRPHVEKAPRHRWFREAMADGTQSRTATCLRCGRTTRGRASFPCVPR